MTLVTEAALAAADSPQAMLLTTYECEFGVVKKRHHPEQCPCGCKGGREGHRLVGRPVKDVWTVTLAGAAGYASTERPGIYGTEDEADAEVARLRREGAGVLPGRLVWTSMSAVDDKPHVLALDGFEARVQISSDERLVKFKLRSGELWNIVVYNAATFAPIAWAKNTNEDEAWRSVSARLEAKGWIRRWAHSSSSA
jgi:hypothetical protein